MDDRSSPATAESPPLFPAPDALDNVLYDYHRRADRMGWSPYDLRRTGPAAVAHDFKMPVQNNLLNYRRQLVGMMRAAPSYRHPDVFADLMRAVDRAAQRHERESLQLITPDLGRFDDAPG